MKRKSAQDGERMPIQILMDVDQLAPDEPLSPELVLVLSPALRAQAVARLGAPAWPTPRRRVTTVEPHAADPFERSLRQIVVARVVQLGVIFAAVTILTLAMSVAAHAFR
jgi:hypothetical protein